MSTAGGYFLALAGAEFYAMKQKVFTLDGFKLASPTLATAQCFTQPGFHRYPIVGEYLDGLNCLLNSIFMAAHESRDAQLLMGSFTAVLLSALMPFPLYVLALNIVLSRILPQTPRPPAVVIIAVLCTVVSVSGHIDLMREIANGRRLGDILLFDTKWTSSLTYAGHALFAVDFASVFVTSISLVLIPYQAKLGVLIVMFIITVGAGPGAAIILPWAYRELWTK
ncbi:hypothetical protein CspHIS471_0600260 [Cutaneotrichosporon sp. HIS471]|nr:hypothetical protein CspHIS471_0600260 [Cutaneotrichosporon sp. HIS471]